MFVHFAAMCVSRILKYTCIMQLNFIFRTSNAPHKYEECVLIGAFIMPDESSKMSNSVMGNAIEDFD